MKDRHDPDYDPTSFEAVDELYDFLTGVRIPEGIVLGRGRNPKLTSKQAFTVIWFLQEHMGLLPDHYEKCDECHHLFDSDSEGCYNDEKKRHFCDNCGH